MLKRYAWYADNSERKTHPVGQKQPNSWGLHDMHGNVWEWVQDLYDKGYYSNSPGTDPKGPSSGSYRVSRGGGWGSDARNCRSANRNYSAPDLRYGLHGFRLALSPE
jgi:formylglycine-generating enzyme required for sulfatase activity